MAASHEAGAVFIVPVGERLAGTEIPLSIHGSEENPLTGKIPDEATLFPLLGDAISYVEVGELIGNDIYEARQGDAVRLPEEVFQLSQESQKQYLAVHFAHKFSAFTRMLREVYHVERFKALTTAMGGNLLALVAESVIAPGLVVPTILEFTKHATKMFRESNELTHVYDRSGGMVDGEYNDPEGLRGQMRYALERLGIPLDQEEDLYAAIEAQRERMHEAFDATPEVIKQDARLRARALARLDMQIANARLTVNIPRRLLAKVAPRTAEFLESAVDALTISRARRELSRMLIVEDQMGYVERLQALRTLTRDQAYEYDPITNRYMPRAELRALNEERRATSD